MALAEVTGEQPDRRWSAVVEAATEHTGVSPEDAWVNALTEHADGPGRQDDSGDEWTTRCPNPGHNGDGDSKASLRWVVAADGSLLFTCHGGCDGQAIVNALGLSFLQLRWPKTGYLYRDTDRRLMAIHTKTAAKRFAWRHPVGDDGKTEAGRGPGWTDRLWCWPDQVEHAAAARKRGARVCLWLAEGERDTENVTRALEAGWGPQRLGDQAGDWADLVTTAADGAASWEPQLSTDLVSLRPDRIVILADNDEAGVKRANRVIDSLLIEASKQGTRFDLEAVGWLHAGVTDATDAIHRWRQGWLAKASAIADADEYRWASHKTGWLLETEAKDREGQGTGETALGRLVFGRKNEVREETIAVGSVRIKNVLVNHDGEPVGWELLIGRGVGTDTELLMTTDLGPGLGSWNARVGLFIISVRGVSEAFGAYLRHHGSRAPAVICYDHEGWVTADTFVTRDAGVLVGPETSGGLRGARVADTADSWHFGLRGPGGAQRAAELVAEIGSFRDWDESGPVLGWLTGVAVAPYATDAVGAGAVPGMQAVGTSGHGKTRWLELACRLFGLKASGIGSVTAPGLVRSLASCTGVLWIDDANLDERAGDLLRSAITGGSRARGNIDGGKGVTADRSVAALLYSAEAGFRLNEKAMRERCAVVRFDKSVQQRVSIRNSSGGGPLEPPIRKQYEDMIDLGAGSASKTRLLTDYAGTLTVELAELVRQRRRDQGGDEPRTDAGLREAAAYRFCVWGAELLGSWLAAHGQPTAAAELRDGVALWSSREISRAVKAEKSGVGHYLITELVPRAISARRQRGSWRGSGGLGYVQAVRSDDEDGGLEWGTAEAAEALRDAWRNGVLGGEVGVAGKVGMQGNGVEQEPAAVVVLVDGQLASGQAGLSEADGLLGIAVASDGLYQWATSRHGRDAGVSRDGRYTNLDAIRAQLAEVSDKEIGAVRIKVGSAHTRMTYRVITDPAVLDRIREHEEQV